MAFRRGYYVWLLLSSAGCIDRTVEPQDVGSERPAWARPPGPMGSTEIPSQREFVDAVAKDLRDIQVRSLAPVSVTDGCRGSVERGEVCRSWWSVVAHGAGVLISDRVVSVERDEWLPRCGLPADGVSLSALVVRVQHVAGSAVEFKVDVGIGKEPDGTWVNGRWRVDDETVDGVLATGSRMSEREIGLDSPAFEELCERAREANQPGPATGWWCSNVPHDTSARANPYIPQRCYREAPECEAFLDRMEEDLLERGQARGRCSHEREAYGYSGLFAKDEEWIFEMFQSRAACEFALRPPRHLRYTSSCRVFE